MVNSSKKKKAAGKKGGSRKGGSRKGGGTKAAGAPVVPGVQDGSLDFGRAGMPAVDSVVEVRTLQPAGGAAAALASLTSAPRAFRIIRTNEVDGYEKAASPHETLLASLAASKKAAKKAAKKAPDRDSFSGTARKAAKLSISAAAVKSFKDVRALVNTLPSHGEMVALHISTAAGSDRVAQEERNVRVKTFLYAASREDDNDFHLILGRDPSATPEVYMTMELSGLPPQNKPSFPRLKAARDAFKAFFGAELPGTSYDFYDPPIPVTVEGSLFWDASHATGTRPGPKSLKSRMPVVWEVHPISKIEFNP